MKNERSGAGRGHKLVVLLLLLVVFLLAAISCALALRVYRGPNTSPAGRWRMRVDLTETARARANGWLQRADLGERVDTADALIPIQVGVLLELTPEGGWSREVEESSLAAAEKEAENALAASLRELLLLRFADAGRAAGTPEDAEARFQKAVGMSSAQYLESYGPRLLPTPEELRETYEGSGSYEIDGQRMRIDGQPVRCLVDDGVMALVRDGKTEVYERAN